MTYPSVALGLLGGSGLFLLFLGGRRVAFTSSWTTAFEPGRVIRAGAAVLPPSLLAIGAAWVVGSPAAGALALALVSAVRALVRVDRSRSTWAAEMVAIKDWVENLQGLFAVGHGPGDALHASAATADRTIQRRVELLADAYSKGRPEHALRQFQLQVGHVHGDRVAALLLMAARGRAGRLVDSFGHLAAEIRADVEAFERTEGDRARDRTETRLITLLSVALVALLLLVSGDVAQTYRGLAGQIKLVLVGAPFIGCLWLVAALGRARRPERFILPSPVAGRS